MKKELQQLSDEALEKKLSVSKGLIIGLAIVTTLSFCIMMYVIVALGKTSLMSLIAVPLGMLPLLIVNGQQLKKIKTELARRA